MGPPASPGIHPSEHAATPPLQTRFGHALRRTRDLRIRQVRPLIPPAILLEEIPITEAVSNLARACVQLETQELPDRVMVDCSHGNSSKQYRKREEVAAALCAQIGSASPRIMGVMLESHLVEGRQDYVPGRPATYGQSIRDAWLSFSRTEPILERLAGAVSRRG